MIVEPPTALYMSGETGRVVLDDRVVRGEAAHVRAGRPVLARLELPVELVARVVRAVEPVALLQADDAEAGLGQAQATTPPDAPAPMIRTSAGSLAMGLPLQSGDGSDEPGAGARAVEQADLAQDVGQVGAFGVGRAA